MARRPTVALALGAGGARGLAHIAVLKALDEMDVRPAAIAGTSIGAIIGAAYAAGIPAARIRAHAISAFRNRARTYARLLETRVGRLGDLFARGNPVMLDAELLLDRFWPNEVPDTFEELAIPFFAVATDFHGRSEAVFSEGSLVSAVAASMALPGLVRPVPIGGGLFIDGGAVNPLPCDVLEGKADILVAVDVTGGPSGEDGEVPSAFAALFAAAQIMISTIASAKMKARAPDILVRPAVESFGVLDFFKARHILEAAEPAKAAFAAELAEKLGR